MIFSDVQTLQVFIKDKKCKEQINIQIMCSVCNKSFVRNTNVGLIRFFLNKKANEFFVCKPCGISQKNKSRSEEEKQAITQKKLNTRNSKSEEEKKARNERQAQSLKKYYEENPEARKTVSEHSKAVYAAYTEEQKEEKSKHIAKSVKEYYTKPGSREKTALATSVVWANRSDEQKLEMRRKACRHKNIAKDGTHFDSSWELKYYEYCLSKGYDIKREPVVLRFTFEGKQHCYIPDFSVDGKLVEVKGNHFKNEDGTFKNPFDRSVDALYEAKRKCGLENGVVYLYLEDLQSLGIL